MAKPPKDDKEDAADALAAFAAGEHQDDTPAGSGVEGHAHVDLGSAKPVQPPAGSPRQSPPKPAMPAARAAGPTPAGPPRSRVPGPPPQRPAAPPMAANPLVPARPPPAAPARPMSPTPGAGAHPGLSHEQEVAREAEGLAHVIEDDDMMNMPAATPDMIAYRRPAPPPRKRVHVSRTVGFKQTIIPTLLTLGVLLPALALWSFLLGEESPVHGANWIPLTLAGIGVVMLFFAVVTMFQVKHQIQAMKQPRA